VRIERRLYRAYIKLRVSTRSIRTRSCLIRSFRYRLVKNNFGLYKGNIGISYIRSYLRVFPEGIFLDNIFYYIYLDIDLIELFDYNSIFLYKGF
jgi:hypothetical protein